MGPTSAANRTVNRGSLAFSVYVRAANKHGFVQNRGDRSKEVFSWLPPMKVGSVLKRMCVCVGGGWVETEDCALYQAMDVFHIKSWMYSISSPLVIFNTGHSSTCFSKPLLPPPPLRLVSCLLSTAYVSSSHLLTKLSPVYCWLPDLYDLIGFHFSAPAQGPQKGCIFLPFLHSSTLLCRKYNLP